MPEPELDEDELTRLRAAFAQVAYARLLGLELTAVARGAAVVSLDVRAELTRMEGIVHGGALASLMDTAAAFAVLSLLAPGEQTRHRRSHRPLPAPRSQRKGRRARARLARGPPPRHRFY